MGGANGPLEVASTGNGASIAGAKGAPNMTVRPTGNGSIVFDERLIDAGSTLIEGCGFECVGTITLSMEGAAGAVGCGNGECVGLLNNGPTCG